MPRAVENAAPPIQKAPPVPEYPQPDWDSFPGPGYYWNGTAWVPGQANVINEHRGGPHVPGDSPDDGPGPGNYTGPPLVAPPPLNPPAAPLTQAPQVVPATPPATPPPSQPVHVTRYATVGDYLRANPGLNNEFGKTLEPNEVAQISSPAWQKSHNVQIGGPEYQSGAHVTDARVAAARDPANAHRQQYVKGVGMTPYGQTAGYQAGQPMPQTSWGLGNGTPAPPPTVIQPQPGNQAPTAAPPAVNPATGQAQATQAPAPLGTAQDPGRGGSVNLDFAKSVTGALKSRDSAAQAVKAARKTPGLDDDAKALAAYAKAGMDLKHTPIPAQVGGELEQKLVDAIKRAHGVRT